MDEFQEMVKQKAEYKKARDEKYLVDSKSRLSKIMKKKIQTTMVGAISSVEDKFGFLWENEDGSEMSSTQKDMYELFQSLRSDIFDKGNAQSRNVEAELNQYEVKWEKYQLDIPMKPLSQYKSTH